MIDAWLGAKRDQWRNNWVRKRLRMYPMSSHRRTFIYLIWIKSTLYAITSSFLILWALKADWCYCVKYVGFLLLLIFSISQGSVATLFRLTANITRSLLQIYCRILWWKNFENWSPFAKVMPNTRMAFMLFWLTVQTLGSCTRVRWWCLYTGPSVWMVGF